MRVRPGPLVDPWYLTAYLNSAAAQRWLSEHVSSTVIPHINVKTLGLLPLVLPTLDEQRDVVARLKALDAEISARRGDQAVRRIGRHCPFTAG